MPSETKVDKILAKIKNHPTLSLIIVVGIIVIAVGQFTHALYSIRVFLASVHLIDDTFKERPSSERIENFFKLPDTPEIPLKVIDYSSQQNASWPAHAFVDGRRETAWISKATSFIQNESIILSAVNETLFDISSVQICTASSNMQQATMAVRGVTLLGSLVIEEPRTLVSYGTYTLPPKQNCHYLSLAEPSTVRVLIVQITENAGGDSVFISEIKAYGKEHIID